MHQTETMTNTHTLTRSPVGLGKVKAFYTGGVSLHPLEQRCVVVQIPGIKGQTCSHTYRHITNQGYKVVTVKRLAVRQQQYHVLLLVLGSGWDEDNSISWSIACFSLKSLTAAYS